MDNTDQAQDLEEREREAGIERVRRVPRQIPVDNLCLDCGFEVEAARRKASPGAVRCVECQEDHEGAGT